MSTLHRLAMVAALAALAALLGGCTAVAWEPPAVGYEMEVDVGLFYDTLSPHGDWLWLEPYGWVWTPRGVPSAWRPYTYGHWAYSELGWTWVSYWPWGWAPFHYGRWTPHARVGWLWVPGTVWSPAWVAWRWGSGWVGWAALPPGAEWHLGLGIALDGILLRLETEPAPWCFVHADDFLGPHLRQRLVPHGRSAALLAVTRDATRFETHGGRPAVRGPSPEAIEAEVRRAVPRFELRDLPAPPARVERRSEGSSLGVYRPRVKPAPEGRTPPRTRPRSRPPGRDR